MRSSAPGHEAGLGQHLEAVADPEDEPAVRGERRHGAHHRAEPGDHAGPQVVAVGEAAGQDDRGDAVERRLLVPQLDGLGAGQVEGVDRVAIAVAAREDDDADADGHAALPAVAAHEVGRRARDRSMAYASISGFASSSAASRSTTARAAASSAASTVSSTRRPTRTALTPLDPEVAEAALDGPALRVEDARAWA